MAMPVQVAAAAGAAAGATAAAATAAATVATTAAGTAVTNESSLPTSTVAAVLLPPALPQHPSLPLPAAYAPSPNEPADFFGNNDILGQPCAPVGDKRKHGQRGRDYKKRKEKSCKTCIERAGAECATANRCKGRAPKGKCQYYNALGPLLGPNYP